MQKENLQQFDCNVANGRIAIFEIIWHKGLGTTTILL